jgi:hypothetical protein
MGSGGMNTFWLRVYRNFGWLCSKLAADIPSACMDNMLSRNKGN